MRRLDAKAPEPRLQQFDHALRPPRGERRGGAVEIGVGDVRVAVAVARIEPRIFGLERMKPFVMRGVERAIGGGAVEREIGEQRDVARVRGLRERAQRFVCGLR